MMNRFFMAIATALLAVILLLPGASYGQAGIPPSADPGAILNHQQRDLWYRTNSPWMYGPITEEDLKPPEEPVIEFHDMDVEAEIVRPDQPAELQNYMEY